MAGLLKEGQATPFLQNTGDGWTSALGHAIYLYCRAPLDLPKGVVCDVYVLRRVGGNRYYISATDRAILRAKAERELKKYERWVEEIVDGHDGDL